MIVYHVYGTQTYYLTWYLADSQLNINQLVELVDT